MARKIRVYELAKELGLQNKEVLSLCENLGIGVKSHSSGIEEAQADRVRRKVDREGLRRAPIEDPEDQPAPEPASPPAEAASAGPAEAPAARSGDRPPEGGPGGRAPSGRRLVTSRPASAQPGAEPPAGMRPAPSPQHAPPPPPRPAQQPAARQAPPAPAPQPAPPEQPPASAPQQPAAAEQAAPAARQAAAPEAPVADGEAAAAAAEPAGDQKAPTPTSPSGKAIPPPPAPPTGQTGKPIPPPPGMGGRRAAPPRGAPGRPAGGRPPAGAGRPAGAGAGAGAGGGGGRGRPMGAGAPGGGGPSQLPRGQVPGAGGRGGRPGGPRRPRRGRRRRRNLEELEPIQGSTYTPSAAPVPEGEIVIERGSTAQDIGPRLNRSAADVVRFLMQQGEMVTATQSLSDDMIELFAAELGAEVRLVDPGEEKEVELQTLLDLAEEDDDEDYESLPHRPPVVTVMGHVDHGKTLLLDRIRESKVVEGEAGGITQHIGAYQVERDGRRITFIDTPGHEAFTAMRARGAEATDIVVLTVAADDGVMPQTIEAINHAKAAEVPIVVAINKIDRENADPNRVKQQLTEYELVPEDWGGDTICVEVSALQGLNIDELLDNLLVVAELEDLRADADGRARGIVLESNLDVGRGPVATVLVQRGVLRKGDPMVAGPAWGRVRALINDRGEQIEEAGPSTPVQVLGLSDVAEAGDDFVVAPDDRTARTVGEAREQISRQIGLASPAAAGHGGARLEDIFEQIKRGETATLNLILKADVTGSLEALTESLKKLERDEVKLGFVHRAVGGINENDIQLAAASNATIIGFNVRPDRNARDLADQQDVEIRTYEIIYEVLDDIASAMVGMLAPEYEEVVTGDAEVREIFSVPRVGRIAGCYVLNGTITRGSKVRFLRDGTIIWKGEISSLRRFKDDVREVQAGFECGIGLSDFQDLKAGDIIETFEEREIPRT